MIKTYSLFALIILVTACTSNESSKNEASEKIDVSEKSDPVIESSEGVFFVNLENGSTVSSPFLLEMGVAGMEVEPKGAPREGFGHHHLLINDDFAPEGTVIVADETHIHYGAGQISDSVSLEPGTYELTLQFADGMHVSYGEPWSKTIAITVE